MTGIGFVYSPTHLPADFERQMNTAILELMTTEKYDQMLQTYVKDGQTCANEKGVSQVSVCVNSIQLKQ